MITAQMRGDISDSEQAELEAWISESPDNAAFVKELENKNVVAEKLKLYSRLDANDAIERIMKRVVPDNHDAVVIPAHRVHFLRTAWFRYAAAIFIVFGVGAYLYTLKDSQKNQRAPVVQSTPGVAAPTSVLATITLSNGKVITLDSLPNGLLANEGGVRIEKSADGRIIYKGPASRETAYNTITVPRGSAISNITLADGTRVFINAASSLTYPVAFTGKERRVEVTGEAFFEVAKDGNKPFVVKTRSDVITVLGTQFNVNAYPDEAAIKTSLLEGSVKIGGKVLSPGQAYTNGRIFETNVQQDVAWKNGVFNFNDQKLSQVLRQISRWYDVDIVYQGDVPDVEFIGEMSKSLNLSDVLEFLRGSRIHAKLEGKKLILTK